MHAMAIRARSLVNLRHFVGPKLYRLTMETPHVGLIDSFHDPIVPHQFGISMAFRARLANVLLEGRRFVFQDTYHSMRATRQAVAIDTGGDVRITLLQLLPVDALQMDLVLVDRKSTRLNS